MGTCNISAGMLHVPVSPDLPSRVAVTSLPCRTAIVGGTLMQVRGHADSARQHFRMLWSLTSHAVEMVTE